MEVVGYPAGLLLALGLSLAEVNVTDPRLIVLGILTTIALAAVMASALRLDWRVPASAKMPGAIAAVLYIAVPLGLLAWVWRQTDGTFYLLFTLVVIWSGDTAGYYIGKSFGRHKSSPIVSPKKTWEGAIASFTAALLVGAITAAYFWGRGSDAELIMLAGFLNVAGQLGDLAESGLKRRAGVKDSSNLIPGHGGVLDRIDALLFAAPVLWYYWLWKAS
jgi:phosphatidate cytidylyltransferase